MAVLDLGADCSKQPQRSWLMGVAVEKPRMSAEDFLSWDATQTVRHEFVAGEVFAMAGALRLESVALDLPAGQLWAEVPVAAG